MTETTESIAGTVRDAQGALIARAKAVLESPATSDKPTVATDEFGNYSARFLSEGSSHSTKTALPMSPLRRLHGPASPQTLSLCTN